VNFFENLVIFTEKPVAALFLTIAVSVATCEWSFLKIKTDQELLKI